MAILLCRVLLSGRRICRSRPRVHRTSTELRITTALQLTMRPYSVFCCTMLAGIALLASFTLAVPEALPRLATPVTATPLGQSVKCPPPLPAFPGIDAPIKRVIIDEMTPFLHQTLQQHNITLLLVLPGPSSDSSKAQQDSSAMKVDWNKLTGVQQVDWVYSYQDFMAKWHSYFRHMHNGGLDMHRRTASTAAEALTTGADDQQQQQNLKPAVALLIQGYNGRLGLQQLNLAAAVSRRLRHMHSLSLSYSTHSDKADSLVVSTSEAVPLGAAFLSTSVFRDAFNNIYQNKLWGEGGGGSGAGSDITYTATIRDQLPQIINRYNITSMLDSSCGSMHWMPKVLESVTKSNPDFRFMGTDVVCSLIAKHTAQFKANSSYQFQCVDYASQRLPSGYDLIFSRDSLQHIPLHGAWQFLNNVRASGARYLLVGSYVKSDQANFDIKAGSYYPVDLMKPPFSLSKPLEVIDEKTADGKHMLLFDVAQMTWQDPLWGLL